MNCLLDNRDFVIAQNFGNGNGKWCVAIKRGKYYVQKRTSEGIVYLHRLITNAPKGMYVDHISGNTLDNRQSNLRVVKNSTNLRNGRLRPNNTSGMTGVWWNTSKNRWVAEIKVNYKKMYLGSFKTSDEAAIARIEAEKRFWNA